MAVESIQVAIVVVTYRSAQLTIDCLRSIETERGRNDANIQCVVVDNHSGDAPEIAEAIKTYDWTEWVTLVVAERNGGFAYGNNLGIETASKRWNPKYFHLLNPDTLIQPGAVERLVQFLETTPNAGIAGGAFKNGDGSDWKIAFRFPTFVSELINSIGFGPLNVLADRWRVAMNMDDSVKEVDWISGASMMVSRDVFKTIGGMDEEFFLYFEETEFCFRAKKAGYSIWYVPTSQVIHLAGQSTQVTERNATLRRLPSYWFNSRRRYYARTHGIMYSIFADLCAVVGTAAAELLRLVSGKQRFEAPHYVSDLCTHSLIWTANGRANQRRSTVPRFFADLN